MGTDLVMYVIAFALTLTVCITFFAAAAAAAAWADAEPQADPVAVAAVRERAAVLLEQGVLQDLRCWCINIPVRIDRAETMRRRARLAGIPPDAFRIFAATDRTTIPDDMSRFMGVVPAGRIGCWLSHTRVWTEAAAEAADPTPTPTPTLVLEDDFVFGPEFLNVLAVAVADARAASAAGVEWDLVMLGRTTLTTDGEERAPGCECLVRVRNAFYGTFCYLLNPRSVPKMLQIADMRNFPTLDADQRHRLAIDTVLSDLNLADHLTVLGLPRSVQPALGYPSLFESDTAV